MQLDFHSIIINIGLRHWSLERRLSIARHYYIAIVHPNLAITSKTCSHCPIKRFGTLQHQERTGIFQKFIISLPPEHKHWDKFYVFKLQSTAQSTVQSPDLEHLKLVVININLPSHVCPSMLSW